VWSWMFLFVNSKQVLYLFSGFDQSSRVLKGAAPGSGCSMKGGSVSPKVACHGDVT
jgi:hypothetical protein